MITCEGQNEWWGDRLVCAMLLAWAGTLHQNPEREGVREGPFQVLSSLRTGGKGEQSGDGTQETRARNTHWW